MLPKLRDVLTYLRILTGGGGDGERSLCFFFLALPTPCSPPTKEQAQLLQQNVNDESV